MSKFFTSLSQYSNSNPKRALLPKRQRLSLSLAMVLISNSLLAMPRHQNQSTVSPSQIQRGSGESTKESNRGSLALSDLVERALNASIKELVTGSFDAVIMKEVLALEKTTQAVDRSNEKNDIFFDYILNQLTAELIDKHSTQLFERTKNLSRESLVLWSRQVHQQLPQKFATELAFANQYEQSLNSLLENLSLAKSLEASKQKSMVLRLHQDRVFRLVKDQVHHWISVRSPKIRQMISRAEATGNSKEGSSRQLKENTETPSSRIVKGASTEILIEGLGQKITPVDLIIPDVSMEQLVAQSPSNLRMQKLVQNSAAFAKNFGAQTVLFNLPLYWVTLAHVGLDYSRNPRAISDFFDSLKDPAAHVGFAAFIAANHKFTHWWMHMRDPRLHFLGPYLGMAMGMTASSFISGFWHDPFIQACAKSHLKDKDSCQKAYNGWVLTGKINELTPGIGGLLGTAFLSGFVSKGLNQSARSVFSQTEKAGQAIAGRLGVRLDSLHILPKNIYQGAKLEAYLAELRKVKKLVNTSIITIGSNFVFLAVDPFVSSYVEHSWQKAQQTGFNLGQVLELNTPLGNLENIARFMFFDNVRLPHEISIKTQPQVLSALDTSLDAFLDRSFELIDPQQCLKAAGKEPSKDSTSQVSKQVVEASQPREWYGAKNQDYEKLRRCLEKADLPFWLGRYAEVQKDWRTFLLGESVNASLQWSATIGDFLTMFNGTRFFYEYVIKNIWEHRRFVYETERAGGDPEEKKKKIAENRERLMVKLMRRAELLKLAYEATKVPAVVASTEVVSIDGVTEKRVVVPGRTEEEKERFADLYPSLMGSFRITELSDYLITSMVCGPRAEDQPSIMQKMTSLRWLPWESIAAHVPSVFSTTKISEAFSPVLQTSPGMKFQLIPPRITEKSEVCDRSNWLPTESGIVNEVTDSERTLKGAIGQTSGAKGVIEKAGERAWQAISSLGSAIVRAVGDEVRGNQYSEKGAEMLEGLSKDQRQLWKDQSAPIYWQKIKVGNKVYRGVIDYLIDHARVDILRPDDQFDHGFVDWYRKVVEEPIANPHTGLWKDVVQNYDTLLSKHFFPVLSKNELEESCSDGSIRCGLTSGQYIQSQGVLQSASIELQTYFRVLNSIVDKLSAKESRAQEVSKRMVDVRSLQDQFLGNLESLREQKDPLAVEALKEQLEALKNAYVETMIDVVPDNKVAQTGIGTSMARIFELMANVLTEIESYQHYVTALDLNKNDLKPFDGGVRGSSKIDPRARFSH